MALRLNLIDAEDPSSRGSLTSTAPIRPQDFLSGGFLRFVIDETDLTTNVRELFNLMEPPSFEDSVHVWGELLGDDGMLVLFLSAEEGDRSHRFAALKRFAAEIMRPHPRGAGQLFRHKKLPPDIIWEIER
jgi:hypothetical protein